MRRQRLLPLSALCCAGLVLSGCAAGGLSSSSSGSGNLSLEQQVQQHDMMLKQLQPAQADMWNQVQTMRQELNALKGQVDDLRNVGGARALVERVNRHDAALRQIETSMALNLNLGEALPSLPPGGAAPAAAAAAAPVAAATAMDGTGNAAQDAANMNPYAAGANFGGQQGQTAAPAPAASTWGQASPQPQAAPAAQKDISLALYDAGLNAFNARRYDEAQRSFSDFIKNYGNHSMAPEAQYYLAECYFQRNQFADAALAYDTVITKYSKSSKAPAAYLKQGICFSKINQGAAAKSRLNELIRKYPNSAEAARAKTFLKTNK